MGDDSPGRLPRVGTGLSRGPVTWPAPATGDTEKSVTWRSKSCKIPTMDTAMVTIKTTRESWQILRIIAAHTNEKQYEVLARLVRTEWETLQKQEKESHGSMPSASC